MLGRRGIGIDTRISQVQLAARRMQTVTPMLMVPDDEAYKRRQQRREARKAAGAAPAEVGPAEADTPRGEGPGLFDGR
jgi:hypothetical protein